MNRQTVTSSHQSSIWLHLFLVASVVLYLYSPFIDHWFGGDTQSRPHTHISIAVPHQIASDHENVHHDEHDDLILCSLDIDAIMTLLFGFYSISPIVTTPPEPHAFAWEAPSYLDVATLFPTVITPPPNLL